MAQPQVRPAAANRPLAHHVEAAQSGAAQAMIDPREQRRLAQESKREKIIEEKVKKLEENAEKRQKEMEELYDKEQEKRKKRLLESGESVTVKTQEITIATGQKKKAKMENKKASRLTKAFMQDAYHDSKFKRLESKFFFLETQGYKQMFNVRQGNDYQVFSLVPLGDEKYRQETSSGPEFSEMAKVAEEVATSLHKDKPETYSSLEKARERVGRDINRMAGDLEPRGDYGKSLLGKSGLLSFAAIIRAEKARVPKAVPYIEKTLKDGKTSFVERYGGKKPLYVGTGEGQGPSELKKKVVKEDESYDSDYSSDKK